MHFHDCTSPSHFENVGDRSLSHLKTFVVVAAFRARPHIISHEPNSRFKQQNKGKEMFKSIKKEAIIFMRLLGAFLL